MRTDETANKSEPKSVLHDSEQPLPKKPSFLFIVSTSIGILTIILLAASSYFGVAQ